MISKVRNLTDKTLIIPTLRSDSDDHRHVIGRMISAGQTDDLSEYSQVELAKAQTEILNYIARGWLEEVA